MNSKTFTGTCGDNLTWTLDKNGTLSISGTGDMYDYDINLRKYPEWYTHEYSHEQMHVINIIIKDGITSIGNGAFESNAELTGIDIPNTVTKIGNHAFSLCTGLTQIMLPDSLVSIGDYALSSTGINSVTIPYSVTHIGDCVFSDLKLVAIYVSTKSINYRVVDGVNTIFLPLQTSKTI